MSLNKATLLIAGVCFLAVLSSCNKVADPPTPYERYNALFSGLPAPTDSNAIVFAKPANCDSFRVGDTMEVVLKMHSSALSIGWGSLIMTNELTGSWSFLVSITNGGTSVTSAQASAVGSELLDDILVIRVLVPESIGIDPVVDGPYSLQYRDVNTLVVYHNSTIFTVSP